MKIIISFFVLAIALSACQQKETRSLEEICAELDAIDLEMLQIIDQIRTKYKGDQDFHFRFKESQMYWIQYRDRHVRAIYPKKWDKHYRKEYGKELFNPCKCKELTRLTELRVAELRMYLDGGPSDQQECPSHWNIKSPQN